MKILETKSRGRIVVSEEELHSGKRLGLFECICAVVSNNKCWKCLTACSSNSPLCRECGSCFCCEDCMSDHNKTFCSVVSSYNKTLRHHHHNEIPWNLRAQLLLGLQYFSFLYTTCPLARIILKITRKSFIIKKGKLISSSTKLLLTYAGIGKSSANRLSRRRLIKKIEQLITKSQTAIPHRDRGFLDKNNQRGGIEHDRKIHQPICKAGWGCVLCVSNEMAEKSNNIIPRKYRQLYRMCSKVSGFEVLPNLRGIFVQQILLRVASVLKCNAFVISTDNYTHEQSYSLYSHPSLINHDCSPNIGRLQEGTRAVMFSLVDIHPGQELLLSYVNPSQSATERRRHLAGYGFRCNCERCKINSKPSLETCSVCGAYIVVGVCPRGCS